MRFATTSTAPTSTPRLAAPLPAGLELAYKTRPSYRLRTPAWCSTSPPTIRSGPIHIHRCGCRPSVGQPFRAGRLRVWSAAVHGRPAGARGRARFQGWLAAESPAMSDPLPDEPLASVDGGAVAGRLRGPPEQLRAATLRRRDPRRSRSRRASCEVGMGIEAFRDPAPTQDFDSPGLPIDVAGFRTYAVDWVTDEAVFWSTAQTTPLPEPADVPDPADGRRLRLPRVVGRRRRPPGPELVVDHIAGSRRGG